MDLQLYISRVKKNDLLLNVKILLKLWKTFF